jgi:hypothetical protein
MENIERIANATRHKLFYLEFYKKLIQDYEKTKNPIIADSIKNLAICIRNEDERITNQVLPD